MDLFCQNRHTSPNPHHLSAKIKLQIQYGPNLWLYNKQNVDRNKDKAKCVHAEPKSVMEFSQNQNQALLKFTLREGRYPINLH